MHESVLHGCRSGNDSNISFSTESKVQLLHLSHTDTRMYIRNYLFCFLVACVRVYIHLWFGVRSLFLFFLLHYYIYFQSSRLKVVSLFFF